MTPEQALHVAIIPDGNRRWARTQGLHPQKGHEQAIENFREITKWCREDPRVSCLTVWCFSTENWKRSDEEVSKLMGMLEDYLRKEHEEFAERRTRFLHSGRRDRLPSSLATLMKEVEEETKENTNFTLHLAVDYGGKDEVLRAVQKLNSPSDATEENLRAHLDHPELPDIDLVIRTSGEQRTSNFFLWQSAYAEWVFCPKLFPDFNAKDVEQAVEAYERRGRRYGA